MSNETPIVVAPRPVRLGSGFFSCKQDSDDLKLAFNVPESLSRASSRSALPSEALEEFLSILTPSFLHKPRSLTILPDRNISFRPIECDAADSSKSDSKFIHTDPDARWFSSVLLSSPISRIHTRNPFQRQHNPRSPAPLSPLTPSAVPLPSPTPDELTENV